MSNLKNEYNKMPAQVKASIWFVVCSFMQKGISTITTPIFTRILTTEEYGQYSVFSSWLSVLTVFITLKLSYGVFTQGLVKYENDRNRYVSSLQGLGFTLVVAWTVVYLLFRNFWNSLFSLTTTQMLAMLLMIWTTQVFEFWAAEQRVLLNYKHLVILSVATSIAKPTIGLIFVLNADDKVTARILGLALVELFAYSGLFFSSIKRGKLFFSKKYWIGALRFNIPLIPHYLSQTVLNSADRIMISSLVSAECAGKYSLAYSISLMLTMFNTAISNTLSPWIYRKIKDNKTSEISNICYAVLLLIGCICVIFIAFAPDIISIFAPASYHDAIWVMPPIVLSVYFMFCYDLFSKFEFYYEKTKYIMVASILCAVLNIVLNYIFINQYGYLAAGYTTLACYVMNAILHYCCMAKICKEYNQGFIPYNPKIILSISCTFLIIGFLLSFTYNYTLLRYVLILIACIVFVLFRKRIFNFLTRIRHLKDSD